MAPRTRSFRRDCLTNPAVASNIVQYLGIKSLVRICSCSKRVLLDGGRDILETEVSHRKRIFAENKSTVEHILAQENPSRAEVLRAQRLYEESGRLIDDELDQLAQMQVGSVFEDALFAEERKQLTRREMRNGGQCFHVLPVSFYIPSTTDRDLVQPSDAVKANEWGRVWWLYEEEDVMDDFYDQVGTRDPYYNNRKFPFRKFYHPLVSYFTNECMWPHIDELRGDKEKIDAFRRVAREVAELVPRVEDFLHFMLLHVDEEDEEMVDYDRRVRLIPQV